MNPVIQVRQAYKSFKTVKAVRGIDLDVNKGQFTALLGPNGAGKTTLVEMIEGIQKPDSGQITIMGKQWEGNADELHRIIGLSLQETHFIDKLSVRETLDLFASFYDLNHDRVNEILEIIRMQEKRDDYVTNLSGGQRQRLALGIALLNNPQILMLDEPTTGLDPNARREIWAILRQLKETRNTSMILTTHYMEEAQQLCDYVIIIDHGQILKQGTLEELLDQGNGRKMIEFTLENTKDVKGNLTDNTRFPIHWETNLDKGMVLLDHIESELPEFLAFLGQHNARLKNMECRRKTLDDVFTSMTGRRLSE